MVTSRASFNPEISGITHSFVQVTPNPSLRLKNDSAQDDAMLLDLSKLTGTVLNIALLATGMHVYQREVRSLAFARFDGDDVLVVLGSDF